MRIGLVGHAYSGKSSIARVLRDKYGFTILSFAEPIKQYSILMFDKLDLPSNTKSERRRVYQILGNFGRSLDKDIFIKQLSPKFCGLENVVIDDVRFRNEVEFLRGQDFYIVKVDTPEHILFERASKESENIIELYSDESELEIDMIDNFDLMISGTINPETAAELIIEILQNG